jgi:hypothetical protein
MRCVFDICELWNGFGVGVVSGIAASLIFTLLYSWYEEIDYKRRFGKINGQYRGFTYKQDSNRFDTHELNDKPSSTANVRHISKNRLEISVAHDHVKWVGEITMSSIKYGSMVFQYENEEAKHFNGFKRCIVADDFDSIVVVGEPPYGKEYFERVKH